MLPSKELCSKWELSTYEATIGFCTHCFSKTGTKQLDKQHYTKQCSLCTQNRLTDGCVRLHRSQYLCLFYAPRRFKNWDWPVEGVELHGQHGVRLQGRVWVIGSWPRLLSQVPSINGSCHQALQDFLHSREQRTRDRTRYLWGVSLNFALNGGFILFFYLTCKSEYVLITHKLTERSI